MEPNTDITRLIHRYLIPQISSSLDNNPNLAKLARDNSLTVEAIKQIESSLAISTLPPALQDQVSMLLWARIVYSSVRVGQFSPLYSTIFLSYSKALLSKVPTLNLKGEISSFIARMAGAILSTETIEELNQYYDSLKKLREVLGFDDINAMLETAKEKYFYLLSLSHIDSSRDGLIYQLNSLVMMNTIGMYFDFQDYKTISVLAAIAFISSPQTSDEDRREIIGLMQAVDVQSPTIQQQLAILETKYGKKEVVVRDRDEEIPDPEIPEEEKSDYPIYRRDQITFGNPLHVNITFDPNMIVWKGKIEVQGTQVEVAVKEYTTSDPQKLNQFLEKEVKIMKFLSHKKGVFVDFYGSYSDINNEGKHCLGIVMEYCSSTFINEITSRKENDNHFTEEELCKIIYELLDGFAFMEQYKIYHCDVKPHNILISHDGRYKIADFNVSMEFRENSFTTIPTGQYTVQGTDGYMPPEIQKYHDSRKMGQGAAPLEYKPDKVDSFSLGLTFLQAYSLDSVYGLNREQNVNVLRNKLDSIPCLWLKNLLELMLCFDFRERKNIQQCLAFLPDEGTLKTISR